MSRLQIECRNWFVHTYIHTYTAENGIFMPREMHVGERDKNTSTLATCARHRKHKFINDSIRKNDPRSTWPAFRFIRIKGRSRGKPALSPGLTYPRKINETRHPRTPRRRVGITDDAIDCTRRLYVSTADLTPDTILN